ncbi:hypothetical protein [Haliscomenobacter hydrossis]|uniref:hypothetical protein n=1 Tax=Haliscomenobacter hydrossis TaxID=2350 RepID=UPI0011D26C94|nr:hypothetical protein [Haliscomenobacter hydrossis]
MGFEEAIQAEFKKQGLAQGIEQGIEIGEAKRDEELLKNAVPELMQEVSAQSGSLPFSTCNWKMYKRLSMNF